MTGESLRVQPVRVLLAEDSAVSRVLLSAIIRADPRLTLVGAATNGSEAVELTEQLRPDVILMDAYMPVLSGNQATLTIMQRFPTPVVMISASRTLSDAGLSFRALQAGALTLLSKPVDPDDPAFAAESEAICSTLCLMADVPVVRRWLRETRTPLSTPRAIADTGGTNGIDVIAIAASTGGPRTLVEVLRGGGSVPIPVLIVQHMATGFTIGFGSWLGTMTERTVVIPAAGDAVLPGKVYVAPDGVHMSVDPQRQIRLTACRPGDLLCPSADVLFESVADVYARRSIGIVLTGMGADGAAGLLAIRRSGGTTIAQDEASSIVFGMPRKAAEMGAAAAIMTPAEIRQFLEQLPHGKSGEGVWRS